MTNRRRAGPSEHRGRRIFLTVLSILVLTVGVLTLAVGLFAERTFEREFPKELLVPSAGSASPRFFVYRFEDRTNRVGAREEVTEEVFLQRKTLYVTDAELPSHLKAAFVAIEDKRFATHRGVDWYRTVAAGANYFLGFSDSFGASTITQQLVKNLTGDNELTPRRKLQEILYAMDLERRLDKSQILEMYLNVICFADHCDGIGSAAEHYFGKQVSDLNVTESACLAAIINNPSYYHPLRHPENNRKRRELILREMLEQGYLTPAEYEDALKDPLVFRECDKNDDGINSWYTDMVMEDVISDLSVTLGIGRAQASRMLYSGGLSIDLAMDREIQSSVEEYYRQRVRLPCKENGEAAQSALIVIDPKTGDILGVAGAVGEKSGNRVQNFATGTLRSPGSTIKPITVYAPALSKGLIRWSSVYDDVPVSFGSTGRIPWPKNADGVYRGLTNIAYAVAHSTNTVAVRVLEEVGTEEAFRIAKESFHLSSLRNDRQANDCAPAALALGQLNYGVTLRELTNAYTVFADGGVYHPCRSYYRVTDREGRILLSRPDGAERVLSSTDAAIMTKLLEGVVREGTSSAITLAESVECAGKTGTTTHDGDRWFIGYTPELLCGVWCGYEYPAPLSGKNLSTGIWNAVMLRLSAIVGGERRFALPNGICRASYCRDSGELMSEACICDPRGVREEVGWFSVKNLPTEVCTRHVPCNYDRETGGISHGFCPEENLEPIALLRVERHFPIPIAVSDAQYLYGGDPLKIPPNENTAQAYFAKERTGYYGIARMQKPYHCSCPQHTRARPESEYWFPSVPWEDREE